MNCPHCNSQILTKAGTSRGKARVRCGTCDRIFLPGAKRRAGWRKEEDLLLLEMASIPDLCKEWNVRARANKWPSRTKPALLARLERLGASRHEDTGGWLTRPQLLRALGMSESNAFSFSAWMSAGLLVSKSENGHHRVFLGDFVRWCLSPQGQEYAAGFLSKNKSVAAWFLAAINDWADVKNPSTSKPRRNNEKS